MVYGLGGSADGGDLAPAGVLEVLQCPGLSVLNVVQDVFQQKSACVVCKMKLRPRLTTVNLQFQILVCRDRDSQGHVTTDLRQWRPTSRAVSVALRSLRIHCL